MTQDPWAFPIYYQVKVKLTEWRRKLLEIYFECGLPFTLAVPIKLFVFFDNPAGLSLLSVASKIRSLQSYSLSALTSKSGLFRDFKEFLWLLFLCYFIPKLLLNCSGESTFWYFPLKPSLQYIHIVCLCVAEAGRRGQLVRQKVCGSKTLKVKYWTWNIGVTTIT